MHRLQLKEVADSRRYSSTIATAVRLPALQRSSVTKTVADLETPAEHPIDASDAAVSFGPEARDAIDSSDDDDDDGAEASSSSRARHRRLYRQNPLPLPRTLVLSRMFWPGLEGYGGSTPSMAPPRQRLHPRVQEGLARYAKDFASVKAPRKLVSMATVGRVNWLMMSRRCGCPT
jgi:hypothetical protein